MDGMNVTVPSKGRIFPTGSGRLNKSEYDANHYYHLILRLRTYGDVFRRSSPYSLIKCLGVRAFYQCYIITPYTL
jgi:hypothetical protein